MNKCYTRIIRNSWNLRLSSSVTGFLVFFALFFPPTAVFALTEPTISEVQRLLSLVNSSLLRGNWDSSIGSLDEALNMTQELKAEEESADNNNNDNSSGLEDAGDRNNDDSDELSDGMGQAIIDDNVERSQRCVENAKPGEVCALS
jgi:hypothetical protein